MVLQGRGVGRPGKAELDSIGEGELPEKGVGEAIKKVFEKRQRIGRKRPSRKVPGVRQRGRREAVVCQNKRSCTYRFEEEGRAKKAGKTTERRKAPRCSDERILREFWAGSPERLYELKARESTKTTDGRGTRAEFTGLHLKRCQHNGFTLWYS